MISNAEREPHVATMWTLFEQSATVMDRPAEAFRLLEASVRAGEEVVGPYGAELFQPLLRLAAIQRRLDRPADALDSLERVAQITSSQLGARHPYHGNVLAELSAVLRDLGRPGEALQHDEQNLAIRVTTFGREHPETVRVVTDLLDDCHDLGDRTEAARYLDVAERFAATVPGVDDFTLQRIRWHRAQTRP